MTDFGSADATGDRIRSLLKQKGWSQVALARKMGTTPAMLSNLLSGKRRWHLGQLERAASELGVSLSVITGAVPAASGITVELSEAELKRLRQRASKDARAPENLVYWLVSRYLQDGRPVVDPGLSQLTQREGSPMATEYFRMAPTPVRLFIRAACELDEAWSGSYTSEEIQESVLKFRKALYALQD